MEGFCDVEAKLFGPVQLNVPPEGDAVKFSVCPAQIGPLLPAVGAEGMVLTTNVVVPAFDLQPFAEVATTLYVPALAVVTLLIVGFC